MIDDRQCDLFPELARKARPARVRQAKLYPRAVARRQAVERMTLKGSKVREIAAALDITITHVLRIRQALREAGRIPVTPRTM